MFISVRETELQVNSGCFEEDYLEQTLYVWKQKYYRSNGLQIPYASPNIPLRSRQEAGVLASNSKPIHSSPKQRTESHAFSKLKHISAADFTKAINLTTVECVQTSMVWLTYLQIPPNNEVPSEKKYGDNGRK